MHWGSIEEHFPTSDEWRITGVIIMLRAMAVECLLKALWLKSGGQLAKNGKYRGIPGTRDHDLASLADKVTERLSLNLSDSESDLLQRLSCNIAGGRYPIQKNWNLNMQPQAGGDRRRTTDMLPDYDDDLFTSLVSKLRTPFEDELKAFYRG
jgi:hypothetical protein